MSVRVAGARRYFDGMRAERERQERDRPASLFDEAPAAPSWESPQSATEHWKRHALDVIHRAALERATFTVADIADQFAPTYDRRSIGPMLKAAAAKGWIVWAGYASGGPTRNGRPIVAWQSRIYVGSAP